MSVIAVIGDVVRSRRIEQRRRFQRRFQRAMDDVNGRARHLLSPYTLTLGDQFQTVYARAESLFGDLMRIQEMAFPERVRFAVGVGRLTTPLNRERAIGMDGPAFHAGREAMAALKSAAGYFRIGWAGGEGGKPAWVNPTLDLISHETVTWRQTRFRIFRALLDRVEPKVIARLVRLTPAGVYKNIQAGALNTLLKLCGEIARTLDAEVGP